MLKRQSPRNTSLIYPILTTLCEVSEQASLLSHARRRFGRYLAIEVLVLISITVGVAVLIIFPAIPQWSRIVVTAIYAYRVVTMAFAHVSILLLGSGKSTPGDRVHSRLRYLGLTALNFVEIVIFGSLVLQCIQGIGVTSPNYSGAFTTRSDVLFYSFGLATGLGIGRVFPLTPIAYAHCILIAVLGIENIVVVLAILLAIRPEDEAVVKERELPAQDYWEWRSLSFDDLEWAKDHSLRSYIANLLRGLHIESVADIGCGVGHLCLTLASEGYAVLGIDKSQRMIDIASTRKTPAVRYQQGDACDLPVSNACFDAVVMRMLLHNVLPDWRPALDQAKRILKPNGRLLVIEGFPPDEACRSFFIDVLSKVHTRHFFTEEVLTKAIQLAGFQIDRQESIRVTGVSVSSWLANAEPNAALRDSALRMHIEMPESCRQAYNLKVHDGDALIDLVFKVYLAHAAK